uniref:Uncharacterized protein n=1 Tax=Oryza sativa subsp. japonica TaxID=39947 RepID=Q6K4G0_ORYSJ|nr:hypothetical protein [Oryza sativa Japonica Group]BAD25996.1 hypothetical protein [Oryza sativa Japonica Group]
MNNGLAVNLICDESYLLLFQGLVDESSSDDDDDFFGSQHKSCIAIGTLSIHQNMKINAISILGLSCHQEITAAIRQSAYGIAADALDEYVGLAESTAIENLRRYVKAIVEVFEHEYLRSSNENDTTRLLALGENRESWNRPIGIIKSSIVGFLVDSVNEINQLKELYPEKTELKEDAA